MAAPKNRREHFHKEIDPGEVLSDEPIELPAGAKIPAKSVSQQIQEQIAIQIAAKHQGVSSKPPTKS